MTDTAAKIKRPLYKSIRFWSLTLVMLLVVGAGAAFMLAKGTPAWYQPLDPRDQNVQLAAMKFHDIDSKVQAKQLDAVSPGNPVTIKFREDVINSSAVVTMAAKPNNRIEEPVVLFQNGRVTVGIRAKNLPIIGSGVVNFSFHIVVTPPESPQSDPASRCTVVFDSVSVGHLPIPRSVLLDRIPELAPAIDNAIKLEGFDRRGQDRSAQIREFLKNLAGEKPTPVPYLYPGGQNGRSIRNVFLQSVQVADHELSLTFAAEPLK